MANNGSQSMPISAGKGVSGSKQGGTIAQYLPSRPAGGVGGGKSNTVQNTNTKK